MALFELVDTHCHLAYAELATDPDAAWGRAKAAGVTRAVVVGIDAANSKAGAAFVAGREGLYATVGIHPNDTGVATEEDWAAIVALCGAPKVVALGETGLDFYRDTTPKERQEEFLERHAALGLDRSLPLVLHCRQAFPRLREILAPWAARGLKAVLHCFGGTQDDLHPFVEWGWPISFSGILTYPKAPEIREAAKRTPIELCLVETDAPFLAPVPHRGKPNEPAYVVHTAQKLAEVKGLRFEDLAERTTQNARGFFGLP